MVNPIFNTPLKENLSAEATGGVLTIKGFMRI